jgi:hypothetical protein
MAWSFLAHLIAFSSCPVHLVSGFLQGSAKWQDWRQGEISFVLAGLSPDGSRGVRGANREKLLPLAW